MTPTTPVPTQTDTIIASAAPLPGRPARPDGLSMLGKLRWGATHPPLDPGVPLAGRTVLVTGANTGLGHEAAVQFAALGCARLLLGVRSAAKGEDAKARILARCPPGRDPASVVVLTVEMGDFASVMGFVRDLGKEVGGEGGLDAAVLCAGVGPPRYEAIGGWETGVMVNVLATAAMALGVLPLMDREKGRLCFVNSSGSDLVRAEWVEGHGGSLLACANDREGWTSMKGYCTVKLLGLAVMKAVARAAGEDGVVVNAVCPGMCKTDLGRDHPWYEKVAMGIVSPWIHRSAEEGSRFPGQRHAAGEGEPWEALAQ